MKRQDWNIPPVHKRVKKHDLVFEYILTGILVVLFTYILLDVLGAFPSITKRVMLTSVAGTFIALYALIWQVHSAIRASKILVDLKTNIKVEDNYVTFSCAITNSGTRSIYPYLTNLYINEGVEENVGDCISKYRFEKLTDHTVDRRTGECFNCRIADFCKTHGIDDSGIIEFPKCVENEFSNTMRFCCNLRHLSFFPICTSCLMKQYERMSFSESVNLVFIGLL